MRAGLALIVAVFLASPAQACHRFSVWNYPFVQPCEAEKDRSWYVQLVLPDAGQGPEAKAKIVTPHFSLSQYDTIILHLPPGTSDEEGRAQAIEILKQVMGR